MKFFKAFKFLCLLLGFSLLSGMFFSNANLIQTHAIALGEQAEGNVYEQIDSYLADAYQKAHFPAMSITIVDKDNVLLSKTYGKCESIDTPFLLGSVSKSFTALCIIQLEELGKIDLDAPISKYFQKAISKTQQQFANFSIIQAVLASIKI